MPIDYIHVRAGIVEMTSSRIYGYEVVFIAANERVPERAVG